MIDLEILRNYCSQKKGVTEDFPFNDVTMVIKVGSKMFALISLNEQPLRMNLKCDPFAAEQLRQMYPSILPGYYMNKRHWNTIILNGTIPDKIIFKMIDDSYELVFAKLRKKEKEVIKKSRN